MAAEQFTIPDDFDIDIATAEELREVLKKLIKTQRETGMDHSRMTRVRDKFVGKPTPWDGENEADFKAWDEKFVMFMSSVFDKSWKKIFKQLGKMEDEEIEDDDEEYLA